MKAVFLFALVCLLGFSYSNAECIPDETDGQPDCSKVNAGNYRNFWDPVHYWVCNGSGSASKEICPDEHLFSEAQKQCIPWDQWEWTMPCKQ